MNIPLFALPGFLGQPSDWNFLSPLNFTGIHPFDFSGRSLSEWAAVFNQSMQSQTNEKILLGYSLGGRMALHALINSPVLWKGAVIISAHTGLKSQTERTERIAKDEAWALRFLKEEWKSLIQAWNNQSIFAHDKIDPIRLESDHDRNQLAFALRAYSLGTQEDLSDLIEKLPIPLLWIVGQEDHRCCQIATSLHFLHPLSRCIILPNSGHRIPWIAPLELKKCIENFALLLENAN